MATTLEQAQEAGRFDTELSENGWPPERPTSAKLQGKHYY
jgi:hypothetical protein